jgi:serine/threonine protein phosphatase PrpC
LGRWHIASGQWIGARERQEDAFMVLRRSGLGNDEPGALMVVADGMGGHAGGDLASRAVVDGVMEILARPDANEIDLAEVIERANAKVRRAIEEEPAYRGMGSTLVAVDFHPPWVRWCSVGDSLLLTVSGRAVRRLNQDHSMAPLLDAMAEQGEISRDEAAAPSSRNKLRSVVRGGEIPLIDVGRDAVRLDASQAVIVASDGLATLSNDQIADIVAANFSAEACIDALLDALRLQADPHQDNVTIIVAMCAAAPVEFNGSKPQISRQFGGHAKTIGLIALAATAAAAAGVLLLGPGKRASDVTPLQPAIVKPSAVAEPKSAPAITPPSRSAGLPGVSPSNRVVSSEELFPHNSRPTSAVKVTPSEAPPAHSPPAAGGSPPTSAPPEGPPTGALSGGSKSATAPSSSKSAQPSQAASETAKPKTKASEDKASIAPAPPSASSSPKGADVPTGDHP